MSDDQNNEPLSYSRVRHRLHMMIEATTIPVYSIAQAQELIKNLNQDLITIKISIEQLNEKRVS